MRSRLQQIIVGAALGTAMFSQAALVGEWLFDEGGGITMANSADTGSDYDGTILTGAGGDPEFVPGHDGTGYAIDFGGLSGARVAIQNGAFLNTVSNEISIAFWAYGNVDQPQQQIAFQGQVGTAGRELQSHLPWSSGAVYWDAGNAGRQSFGASEELYKGDWTFWVMTKNAIESTQKVYANGILLNTKSDSVNAINGLGITRFAIGNANDGLSPYYGTIDDFQIYDHELTGDEIATMYDPNLIAPVITKTSSVGESPLEVIFDGSDSFAGQGIAEYLWDFGEDPSNVVFGASGQVVTNTFLDVGTYTITLYVVDTIGGTNTATTSAQVIPSGDTTDIVFDLVAITNIPTSSEAFYGTSITNLLTDPFVYYPSIPNNTSPNTSYQQGFHGNDPTGADVLLSFTNSTPYTTTVDKPVIILDAWGRGGYQTRDQDFDVVLYNGGWEDTDKVTFGEVTGLAIATTGTPYTRGVIDTIPLGTTFDRMRIIGHNTSGQANNPFTLTEIRLAAIGGEVKSVVAKLNAAPVSGYYPLGVGFGATNSFATVGTITDYLWDFGDGNTDSGATSTNTYMEAGTFTNTLTVINTEGSTNYASVVITANNPIVPNIATDANGASVGINTSFDAAASTNYVADALTTYDWDFGDGTTDSGVSVTKSFAEGGTYTVTLTVGDAAGRSNTATAEIEISGAPVLTLTDGMLIWTTPDSKVYEIQYTENLVNGTWATYSNVTATPPVTSVELPIGRTDVECFQVLFEE
ncbi:PKD domain-containing protein [Pontiellaceae bacterium B1224]|nr:PKD domain-containing protein [Pontiellaceae bacterium B1224]